MKSIKDYTKHAEIIADFTGEIEKDDILNIISKNGADMKSAVMEIGKKYQLDCIDSYFVAKVLCPEMVDEKFEKIFQYTLDNESPDVKEEILKMINSALEYFER